MVLLMVKLAPVLLTVAEQLEGTPRFTPICGMPVEMLAPSARHHAVLSEAVKELPRVAGNLVFDFHTAVLMREHGIRRIVTNDMDFHRFPWVEVINPLA